MEYELARIDTTNYPPLPEGDMHNVILIGYKRALAELIGKVLAVYLKREPTQEDFDLVLISSLENLSGYSFQYDGKVLGKVANEYEGREVKIVFYPI